DDKTKGLAEEIRASGFEVVLVGKNNGSRQTSVVCYNDETCKQANDLIIPLLKRRGFPAENATRVNREIPAIDTGEASATGKGASVSAFEKRIAILIGAPATAPATAPAAEKIKKGKNKNG